MHGSTEPACTASTLTTDSAGGGPAQTAEQGAGRAAGAERLRRLFRFFAATQCRGRSPVYEALSEGVADSDALLDLLMSTPAEQRRPTLLLAAVSFLLAVRPGAPLAAYYPVHGGRRTATWCRPSPHSARARRGTRPAPAHQVDPDQRDPPVRGSSPRAQPRQPALARVPGPDRGRRQRGPQPALRPLPLPRRRPGDGPRPGLAGPDLLRAARRRTGRPGSRPGPRPGPADHLPARHRPAAGRARRPR
jgi:hypothetical protein